MRKLLVSLGLAFCLVPVARAQSPMFIINGVRLDECEGPHSNELFRLQDIDPAAIENIEVVKGSAAVRQYGAGAANGVIVVSTKKTSVVTPTVCGVATAPNLDVAAKYLFAPEFVLAHQEAIGLTDSQRTEIRDAMATVQSKAVVDAQFKLAAATERLANTLSSASVDEAGALRQIDETLALEREVKRAQMTLLVRVKNQLTPQQQKQLDKLRSF